MRLSSEYRDTRGFAAKEQGGGVGGWKVKGSLPGQGILPGLTR